MVGQGRELHFASAESLLEGPFQSGRSVPNNLHNNQKMHILLLGASGRTGEPLMRIPIKLRFNIL
jgi:hypothetical protein